MQIERKKKEKPTVDEEEKGEKQAGGGSWKAFRVDVAFSLRAISAATPLALLIFFDAAARELN